jgi:hypothetical protein
MIMPNPDKLLDEDSQVYAGAGHGIIWWFNEYDEEMLWEFEDFE